MKKIFSILFLWFGITLSFASTSNIPKNNGEIDDTLAGNIAKPMLSKAGKGFVYVFEKSFKIAETYELKFNTGKLYAGLPFPELRKKVEKLTEADIAKLPADENGIRIADVDEQAVPIGPKESLDKIGGSLSKYTNISNWLSSITNDEIKDIVKSLDDNILELLETELPSKLDDLGMRYFDMVDKTDKLKFIYYEFKSVVKVPPAKFAEQFLKDLQNAQSLDQIKWIFDGRKIENLPQRDFVKALESSKEQLFNGNARMLFEKEFGETFLDADDLMQTLYKDESWFKKVFKK